MAPRHQPVWWAAPRPHRDTRALRDRVVIGMVLVPADGPSTAPVIQTGKAP
jgi:hypothetical protein